MSLEKQVQIMEKQLSLFDNLLSKMQYMYGFFDPDPEFTLEARNIVRGNISKNLPK